MKTHRVLLGIVSAGVLTSAFLLAEQPVVREAAPPRATVAEASSVDSRQFKPLRRLDRGFSGTENLHHSPEAAKMAQLLKELNDLYAKDEHRVQMMQLMNLIHLANQQPEVRRKVEDARKEVHDYVRRVSPELLPYLEKMDAPRDLSRKQNQLTEIVF